MAAQGSALRGASLLIVLQVASRAITFIANQLLLRFLTAQLLGVSTQLEVYYLSVLFFARESLRVAIQRQDSTAVASPATRTTPSTERGAARPRQQQDYESQSVVNVGHLAVVFGLGAAVTLGSAYLHYIDASTAATPHLSTALYIYGVASIVELLSEPAFVVLQHRLRFGPRATAESLATLLRCTVTFGTANWAWRTSRDLGVIPIALGQLGYGLGLLGTYAWYGWGLASAEGFSLLPKRIIDENVKPKDGSSTPRGSYTLGYFYTPTLHLASSMTAQSFVKHILTQGDTFLVSILSSPQSQGVYALANNYGSLLARLIFQPVEESSRNYFSKLLSAGSSAAPGKSTLNRKDGNGTPPLPQEAINKAKNDLHNLFRSYILLSTLVVTLGPFGAPLLVQIIAGRTWAMTGAGWVLSQYCLYIPLLALNGISEAFVSSVATESQIHRQSLWMGAFSIAFGIGGFVFLRVLNLGAAGLVYANAINMFCRIFWSAKFISSYFTQHDTGFSWKDAVPAGSAIYIAATAALWQLFTQGVGISVGGVSDHVYRDVVKVTALAIPYVALMAFMERRWILDNLRTLRRS
ncbi:Rft protein-domain-containing protein [Xylariales sp. PMI_506]|nr:Rft protein-domain-containing protein [Xylariales sp. PMI_506]